MKSLGADLSVLTIFCAFNQIRICRAFNGRPARNLAEALTTKFDDRQQHTQHVGYISLIEGLLIRETLDLFTIDL